MKPQKPLPPYDHLAIEKKWQKQWAKKKLYVTKEDPKKDAFYVLDMFPYPSGEGLHVGHPKGYIATDVVSRMKRMQGHSVLHPMGFDAFGLPAENYAIKMKTNPAIAVEKNVQRYKEQLEMFGFDYDWSREINTTDPAYYKWTQWIFLKLLEKGLAYESHEPINWCPSCKTGLANEDLEDGKCERCGSVVEKKPIRQWVLKITDYAERLLADLDATEKPIMIRDSGPDAVRAGLPLEERNAVVCVVKHWSEDKFLCLRWKSNDWHGLVVGGVEKGEQLAEAAVREVQEETGYQNVRFVREFAKLDSQFYQAIKKVNRFAHFTGVYLELTDDTWKDIDEKEKALHEVVWLPRAEVTGFLNRPDMNYLWDVFSGKQQMLPALDWPTSIKELQRNWIGRSEGVNFNCKIKELNIPVQMYNSVPQTYHAETFTVIAPDHPLVKELVKGTPREKEVLDFAEAINRKKAANRFDVENDMEGIFTGRYIESFADTGRDLPIWIASYVVSDYGTGIVNASAHDERDFAFAKKYNLPLRIAMLPEDQAKAERVKQQKEAYVRDPQAIIQEPAKFRGRRWSEVRADIIEHIVKGGFGTRKVNYRLRDWVFSRQRYWGEPIPVVHCEKCGVVPVPEKELPVKLPKVKSYEPTGTGESPLAAIEKWVNTKCPKCRGKARRETNTMPQWAGSSWYYLRYMDAQNKKVLVDARKEQYWAPVDLYVGGAEHATRHLIYARFWHKFLYDIGVVSTTEPFKKLQHVGLIMAEDGRKMSKRWGNVVNPDEIINTYGADTLRVYEMFMGPFDQQIAWNTNSMIGSRRFLERVWKLAGKVQGVGNTATGAGAVVVPTEIESLIHKTVKKVSADIAEMKFNTAISTMMILLNALDEQPVDVSREHYETFLKLLAPFAPHMSEELWMQLGNKISIHLAPWPVCDEAKIQEASRKIGVQVNGKVRAEFAAPGGATDGELEKLALALPEVQKWIVGKSVKKVIVVKGKLVSVVAAE